MATKRPAKKTEAAKQSKKPEHKRIEVKDLDTKKNPKGGMDGGSKEPCYMTR